MGKITVDYNGEKNKDFFYSPQKILDPITWVISPHCISPSYCEALYHANGLVCNIVEF